MAWDGDNFVAGTSSYVVGTSYFATCPHYAAVCFCCYPSSENYNFIMFFKLLYFLVVFLLKGNDKRHIFVCLGRWLNVQNAGKPY